VVVGGGNSAVEEAVFLSKYEKELTLIHQFDNFQASQTAQEALMNNPKIRVIWDSEIRKVMGEGHALNSVEIENIKTKECSIVSTEGAFVYIGTQPMSEWFAGQVEMDETGYIKASEDTQTNVEGVFAAGDIRTKPIRQVVTAAADGAVAGIMAERYVAGL
jgi:thioredoxin reductase (NADPH)